MLSWEEILRRASTIDGPFEFLPHERIKDLDFEWAPENAEQFELTVTKAPIAILEGFGFVKYSSLPEIYRNSQLQVTNLIGNDAELLLFPAEWYAIIPTGFTVISIFAEVLCFEPGKSTSDARNNCLPYGIPVQVTV